MSVASFRSPLLRPRWRLVALLLAVALCGYGSWRSIFGEGTRTAFPAHTPTAIPVTAAKAEIADFPVYLNGLGTVEPYQTVTVRSRVDGQITKIAFRQGQMVEKGDILVQIDPRPYQALLDQGLAKKAQDDATLKEAQLNLQRYVGLVKSEAVSQQILDTQQALVDGLIAQIKGDQAVIDNAQTQVGYTTIRSPLAGKTGFRLVDTGNIVLASTTTGTPGIVTIVQLHPISVVFTAPEEDVPEINKALAAGAVPVEALSSDGLKVLSQGHLALINNAVDPASGTIGMKATFENADDALWPGLSVSTRLLVATLKQVTVVPEAAVQRGPDGLYSYVIGPGNKVAMRGIKAGQEGNGRSVILQGLSPGEKVVIAGQYRLQNGALVEPREAGSTAAPDKTAQNAPIEAP
jgi:membrane fusion protein, multidrug efflux system